MQAGRLTLTVSGSTAFPNGLYVILGGAKIQDKTEFFASNAASGKAQGFFQFRHGVGVEVVEFRISKQDSQGYLVPADLWRIVLGHSDDPARIEIRKGGKEKGLLWTHVLTEQELFDNSDEERKDMIRTRLDLSGLPRPSSASKLYRVRLHYWVDDQESGLVVKVSQDFTLKLLR